LTAVSSEVELSFTPLITLSANVFTPRDDKSLKLSEYTVHKPVFYVHIKTTRLSIHYE